MKDQDKTKEQLISELEELRRQIAVLEGKDGNRRQIEETLRQTEQRFRAIFDSATIGVVGSMGDGKVSVCNRAFQELVGYSADELRTKYFGEYTHPDDLAVEERLAQELIAGTRPSYCIEKRYIHKDGHYVWVRLHGIAIRDSRGRATGGVCVIEDISERKKAQEALQASEERFRKVFEEGPMGVALVGLDARIQHVNRRFREMLGYTEQEIAALTFRGITYPNDYEADHQLGMRLLRGEIPSYTIEKRYVRKDGQVIWGHLTASMMHDAEGKPTAIIGMIEDVTERKRAEETLKKAHDELEQRVQKRTAELTTVNEELKREIEERRRAEEALQGSEENLRSFFNTIEDLLFVIDMNGSIVWANKTALARLGYPEEELIGRSVLGVHPEDRRQEASDVLASLLAGTAKSCPVPLITKAGKLIPVDTRVVSGRWNGRDVLFGVSKDISELRASEERFAKAFHGNPSPMAISSSDNRYLEVNQAFLRTMGYARGEIIGADISKLGLIVDPEEQKGALAILLKEGHVRDFALDIRTRDGHVRHGLFSGEIIQLQDQPVVLTVMEDITERKQAQEALEREYRNLKHMLQSSDHERQLIAYEIHDGLAQQLAGALMQFDTFSHRKDTQPEQAEDALVRMGGDDAIAAIADQFPAADNHFKLYSAGVIEDIHSDLAAEKCVSLLVQEKERFIQRRLAEAALSQFAYGAIEPVRQLVLTQRLDGELRMLRDNLVETCEIMGERFPEYDQWKAAGDREREEHRRQLEEVSGDPKRALLFAFQKAKEFFSGDEDEEETPPPKPPPKQLGGSLGPTTGLGPVPAFGPAKPTRNVGRNDPCPCGSGKKYKKCCLKKQSDDHLLN